MTDHYASKFQGNILLVDDDQLDLDFLVGILTKNGYDMRLCRDVASALTGEWSEPPALILLAVNTPGMDGYAVCRQLKADERTANVPVIFISASREAINHAQALSAGGVDYISKPYQADEVLLRVETQVNLHRMRQRLEVQNSLLQQEIGQRKHVERELQRHREQIEELIEVRSAELGAASEKLQRDISARRQAKEALHLTRFMVENMSDALYWIDSNIRIVDVNEAACRMLGYTREEFAQMSMLDIDAAPPFDVQPGFAEQIEQTGAATFETYHRAKDGQMVSVEVAANIVKYRGQEFNCCFVRDITERKQAAAALLESEEKYRMLVETAQDPIFISDADGRYLFVNRAAAGLFGLTPDTMIGKSAHDFFSADIANGYLEAARQVLYTGTGLTVEAASEINGQTYWFSINMHPIRDQHGHAKSIQGVVRDITNLKRTSEALRESEGRLRRAELMAHMGHYAFDADLSNAIFSDGVKEIWGFEGSSNPDISQFLSRLHPDDQWALAEMGKAVEEVRGFDVEYRIVRPEGSEVTVHSSAEIARNERNSLPRFFGTMIDITERKKDKALLQRSREQLKAQYKSFPIPTYTYQRQSDEYVLIDYNDAAASATQGGVANFVGRSLRESIADRPDLMRNVERCFHEKSTLKDEVTYKTQSTGQDGYFVSTYVFVPPDLVMIHTEDITESKQAEEALKVKDNAIASAITAIVIASADGTVTYVNPSFLRMWGFDNEQEVLGKPAQELWTQVPQVMESMKATGSWIGEVTAHKKDGSRFDAQLSASFSKDRSGAITHLMGSFMDITERKQAEKSLRESEQQNRALVEAVPDILFRVNREGVFLDYHTPQGSNLYAPPDVFIGKRIRDVMPPEVAESAMQSIERARRDHGSILFEYKLTLSDREHFYEGRAVPLVENETLFVIRDITENKRAEQMLRALNAAAQAMQRVLSPEEITSAVSNEFKKMDIRCAIFIISEDKQKVVMTHLSYRQSALRTIEKLIGIDTSKIAIPIDSMDVFRRPIRDKQTVMIEDIPTAVRQYLPGPFKKLAGYIVQILDTPKSINAPMMVGDEVIGLFSVQSSNLHQSDMPAITAFANQLAAAWHQSQLFAQAQQELAARRNVEEEIRHLNTELEQRVETRTRQLQEANKELEAFSYSVSHDLRAPLRAIDGYTRILLEDYEPFLDIEGKRVCGVIRDNTRQMSRLIDDLLAFSRLSRSSIQSSPLDMSALVTSTFLELVPSPGRERIDFQCESLSPALGDLGMMRQVWVNLLSNAVKFSSKRERAIIQVGSRSENGEIIYYISDNGAGFDSKYIDKLFGVFQRLHSEREFEGTGVGLAIVHQVVKRHGGRVWAEGQIDQGATFYFTLPRKGTK